MPQQPWGHAESEWTDLHLTAVDRSPEAVAAYVDLALQSLLKAPAQHAPADRALPPRECSRPVLIHTAHLAMWATR